MVVEARSGLVETDSASDPRRCEVVDAGAFGEGDHERVGQADDSERGDIELEGVLLVDHHWLVVQFSHKELRGGDGEWDEAGHVGVAGVDGGRTSKSGHHDGIGGLVGRGCDEIGDREGEGCA